MTGVPNKILLYHALKFKLSGQLWLAWRRFWVSRRGKMAGLHFHEAHYKWKQLLLVLIWN